MHLCTKRGDYPGRTGVQRWCNPNPNLSSSAWYLANKELDKELFCTSKRRNSETDFREQAWPHLRINKAKMIIFTFNFQISHVHTSDFSPLNLMIYILVDIMIKKPWFRVQKRREVGKEFAVDLGKRSHGRI